MSEADRTYRCRFIPGVLWHGELIWGTTEFHGSWSVRVSPVGPGDVECFFMVPSAPKLSSGDKFTAMRGRRAIGELEVV
jgi:hypothetical protein